jgi:hypothetical protein
MTLRGSIVICAFTCATVACAPAKPPTTSLRLASAVEVPKGARVTIDDQPVGDLAFVIRRGVALPPGKHQITVEAPGYLPWDREVEVSADGGRIDLDVKLVPIPD